MNTARALRRDEADQLLTDIGATYDRVASAMYGIDTHPALSGLRGGAAQGATATRWQALRPEIDLLWARFAVLGHHLEEARTLRARHRPGDQGWATLTYLLCEPAIPLATDGMPVTSLVATTSPTMIGLVDLAGQLDRRCTVVAGHLSEVEAAYAAVAARLTPVTAAVEAVLALATDLGEPAAGQDLRLALEAAQQSDLGDPLAAAPGGRLTAAAEARWADVNGRAERIRRELVGQAGVRSDFPRLRSALDALMDDLAQAEREARRVYQVVAEKIADPGLPNLPRATDAHRAQLAGLDELQQRAQAAPPANGAALWRRLVDDLHTVEQATRQSRDQARQLADNASGLLARRDELRGRLAAYRVKAAARGLAEDPDLTVQHARARELLFTAPCDLRAATRSLYDYQQTLAAILARATTDDGRSG